MVVGRVATPATQSIDGMLRIDCCHGPSTQNHRAYRRDLGRVCLPGSWAETD
jgi:hypothetical protein